MADLVKLKTGTISKLGQKDSYGNPVIPLEAGSVYFAVDTTNHKGKIVYDASKSNGVDRIVMSTDAENADHAVNASNADKASQAAQLINTHKIDGINFNGTADVLRYAVCATAADTAAKTVSISNFNLTTGARISVRFSTTNTAVNPTLNVSNSGAKPIFYNGSAITAGYLLADKVWDFVYDADLNSNSGAWVLVGEKDTNTTYGIATNSKAGLMSAADKSKLDGIESGATRNLSVRTFKAGDTYTLQNIYAIAERGIAMHNSTGFCATLPGLVEEGTKIKAAGYPTKLSTLRYDGYDEEGRINLYVDALVLGNDGTKTTIVIPMIFADALRQLCFVICKGLTLNFY